MTQDRHLAKHSELFRQEGEVFKSDLELRSQVNARIVWPLAGACRLTLRQDMVRLR